MCSSYSPEDSQAIRRADTETAKVDRIIDRRRRVGARWPYRILATLTGTVAIVMWSLICADAATNPTAPVDRAYVALLTLAALAGFAAVVTGLVWLREHDASQHRADADRIREQQHAREVKSIKDAIGVFLREGDEDARWALTQTQNFINGTGTDGNVRPFRGRG
ncbi:hypothetical protein [Micromonospora profundi]|uniref:hypothetical protein n=1 Tax=Micromonospora profundi TaxID=1420889 RepID=UPI0036492816